MEKIRLKVKLRDKTGKEYARKLRKKEILPAVLYGPHLKKSLSLEVELKDLRSFLSHFHEKEKIITLDIVDQKVNKKREVIIKEVQRNWVSGSLQHIDFYEITRGEKITTMVPLSFVGKAQGEKLEGIVEHLVREVEVECLPRNLPSAIEVDVTSLDTGDFLEVKDLIVPSEVKVITHPQEVVVSVVFPMRKEEEEKVEEEEIAEEVEVVGKKEKKAEEVPGKEEKEKKVEEVSGKGEKGEKEEEKKSKK